MVEIEIPELDDLIAKFEDHLKFNSQDYDKLMGMIGGFDGVLRSTMRRIESLENLVALHRADYDDHATRKANQAAIALVDAIERFHAIVNPTKPDEVIVHV